MSAMGRPDAVGAHAPRMHPATRPLAKEAQETSNSTSIRLLRAWRVVLHAARPVDLFQDPHGCGLACKVRMPIWEAWWKQMV